MTDPGPLVAPAPNAAPSPWAGVWIAEDIEQIVLGVQNGTWIDASLGVAGTALDALAFVSDPIGGLLQYGIAWLIEHVEPLSEALDWLAGDPAQITAHAQTWRNVAGSLEQQADALIRAVRWDVTDWVGAAGDAYRIHADRRALTLRTLSRASEGMALATEGAGLLIGTVRLMVRDAIATVVSRLIVYAGELTASLGTLTPVVMEQAATLCAAWAARITRWLKNLLTSLARLADATRKLGDRIIALRQGDETASTPGAAADSGRSTGGGAAPPPGPPWPARDDIPGPAQGKELKPPHQRHTVTGAGTGEVKADNSVILRGGETTIAEDIRRIAAGEAEWNERTGRYEINGRSYGVEPGGRVYPDSGPGVAKLDRNEYAALKEIVRAGGDPSDVPVFTRDPRFVNNPEAIVKAKAIYDGTFSG